MASGDPAHRRNQSTSNAIPLRDLVQQDIEQSGSLAPARDETHRRTLSERTRDIFRPGPSRPGNRRPTNNDSAYRPILDRDRSPPPAHHTHQRPTIAFVTTPSGRHEPIPDVDDDVPMSPVADRGAFQDAVGFAGLSINVDDDAAEDSDDEETLPRISRDPRDNFDNLSSLRAKYSEEDLVNVQLHDGPAFFTPGVADEEDTQPLTDSSRLQISTALLQNTSTSQRRDAQRSRAGTTLSGLSMRVAPEGTNGRSRSASRLGDELANTEHGLHASSDLGGTSSGRRPSLSHDNPLGRTGTIIRKISQRVVNLSNESDVLERPQSRKLSNTPPAVDGTASGRQSEAALDTTAPPRSPASEKQPSAPVYELSEPLKLPRVDRNPLRGKALGIFSPEGRLRKTLLEFLVHPLVEPLILVLIIVQTVILAVDSAPNVNDHPRPLNWGNNWTDYVLLAIFIVYTLEMAIKMVVSGFIFNATEYSTIDRSIGVRQALKKKADALFTLHRKPSTRTPISERFRTGAAEPDSLLRTFTTPAYDDISGDSRQAQKMRLAHRAFLRHSFNRLDFVAVVSFWISFILGSAGVEFHYQIYVFRMMSCLRILRLLGLTSGTSVILRSLKRAAPTLLNIAFFIGFFWLLFSIIGIQAFKSSLRRTCTFTEGGSNGNNTQNQPPPAGNFQFCGGYLADNGTAVPWLHADGTFGAEQSKGYLCPQGSVCMEGANVYNNTVSFDNILQSTEMVFVIMTADTFSEIMYYLMDSDYLAAAIYFACGVLLLSFWLISLLKAVIASSFQVIREESRSSAFTTQDNSKGGEDKRNFNDLGPHRPRGSALTRAYEQSHWLWIIIIILGLVVQCLRTDTMGPSRTNFISMMELTVTLVLLFEIVFRFVSDWRDFRYHPQNWFDLFLAIITAIIQLPAIKNSGDPYAWLTIFQIIRIYRVILAVPVTRDLIMLVLRHVSGVLNLIVFVFLLTFLAAIFAAQLFRGQLPNLDGQGNYVQVTFATTWNSFLGMYQILSSENWTTIMYNVTRFNYQYGTAWIGATFFIIWFTLANFVVLNMFIAVIQENFDVSEDQKRIQQVRMFLQRKDFGNDKTSGTLSLSSIFKFGMSRHQDPLDYGSAATEMLLKDAVVRDFLDEEMEADGTLKRASTVVFKTASTFKLMGQPAAWVEKIKERFSRLLFSREPNPFYSRLKLTRPYEELDPRSLAQEVMSAAEQRKVSQREYLRRHPKYNVSLFIFQPDNPIRKFCMRIVGPGRGTRIQGVAPNPTVWYSFSAFIYAAIVGMVLLACITTPLYQLEYFKTHANVSDRFNWFVYTDVGFVGLFTVEAVIKVIADGFLWAPNAYFRSSWGVIDGIVLITLWANVITMLADPTSGSRAVGAFKALRALRLLNISDSARDTFHSVIILGGWKVLSAAFVALSLLIPFAIYGLNLFAGKMSWCNDWQQYDVYNLTDCVGESVFSPIGYNMLAPRRVVPYSYKYDFDSFGDAMFILFQIVSQQGWVDLMWSGQSITGVFTQPAWFSQQGNAVFFVVFNLLGVVFVMTLFVSVFMRNYAEQTGVAFLTAEQRSWLELRKLLRQVAPSKRPNRKQKRQRWQDWCYRKAITKNGYWQRTITGILIAHLLLLCLEWYPEPTVWELIRMLIFFVFLLFYIANIVIRIVGLSMRRFFSSAWDIYSLLVVSATFITSIMTLANWNNGRYSQTHKLLLVAVALLLIPRNNQLDQLFKTAAASLSSIANLLATWFVLFLVYAIAFTQTFGLTRFGPSETDNINFRTVPKALILLFKMSVGEQWNQIMLDFAHIESPYCTHSKRFFDGDCGSKQWAYALFLSWNIISLFIFVNLFISLIYESFSYVYQRSSGLSIISREEIRRFKAAWAEYDPNGTGFISKEVFPRFLGELSGVFEMRIYDGDFTIKSLLDDCRVGPSRDSELPLAGESSYSREIDMAKLKRRLADLPIEEIRRRRQRMNTFYEEVLVSADPDRGIAFNTLLMILAHYKVITDNKSLKLEEFLRRRARLQRVEEAVNRNIVIGFFDTLYWSRRFRRLRDAKNNARMTAVPTFGVPEILVQEPAADDMLHAETSSVPTLQISPIGDDAAADDQVNTLSVGRASTAGSDGGGSDTASRKRSSSIQLSPSNSPVRRDSSRSQWHQPHGSSSSIQPDWHFAAAMEGVHRSSPPPSPGLGETEATAARSRANSAVSQHDMVGMFQDSAWGQSMRRTFTQTGPHAEHRPSS